jgi:hypothetical protein
MARTALALNLLLVNLAGPWLCCCTSLRLASLLSPTPAPPSSVCPYCGVPSTPAPEPEAPSRPAPTPECPCQNLPDQLTTLPRPADADQTVSLGSHALVGLLLILTADSPTAEETRPARWDRSPFLDPGDFLRVFHRLRC